MPTEIERKFLPANDNWRGLVEGTFFCQGYLCAEPECAVRVRIAGDRAWFGIKGKNTGAVRLEFEYPLPLDEARQILETLAKRPLIEKVRYRIPFGGLIWEVDEFSGDNQGLVIVEVELETEAQVFDRPDWLGREVTGDPRYYNANLVKHPYKNW